MMNQTSPVKIIAEIGNTHEGSPGLAKRFIAAAAECGADAVKFQTHIFAAESLPNAPNPPYFSDETREEYFNRTAFTLEQWINLKNYAENDCGLEFLSSPFSLEAVDLLEQVGVKTYKIPSGEVTNTPLLIKIAKTGKNVLLSSGMSSWEELDRAVASLRDNGCDDLTVLQCVSEYPCPPEHAGLQLISEMKKRYGLPVGYSDHTLGCGVPAAAVALGATAIEKHLTLSRKMYGSDAKNSVEPDEFKSMVREIRAASLSVSNAVDKDVQASALHDMKMIFEKSVVAARDLTADTIISEKDLAYKKPGDGISAGKFRDLIGLRLKIPVKYNQAFRWKDFAER